MILTSEHPSTFIESPQEFDLPSPHLLSAIYSTFFKFTPPTWFLNAGNRICILLDQAGFT